MAMHFEDIPWSEGASVDEVMEKLRELADATSLLVLDGLAWDALERVLGRGRVASALQALVQAQNKPLAVYSSLSGVTNIIAPVDPAWPDERIRDYVGAHVAALEATLGPIDHFSGLVIMHRPPGQAKGG